MPQLKKFGWTPDTPDQRDHMYSVTGPLQVVQRVDLRTQCPPVYDQGELGSCTANAIGAAIHFDRLKQKLTEQFVPSRLFIYYNERVIENTVMSDSGAMIRDGIKSVNIQGVCPEPQWPYNISAFTTKPAQPAYDHAKTHTAVAYQRLSSSNVLQKACLTSGYPFVFGFSVYESFMSDIVAATGIVPMPKPNEPLLGGHAVMAVGYNDAAAAGIDCPPNHFVIRNSWGPGWGKKGYFFLPYPYLASTNLSDDFWTIKLVK